MIALGDYICFRYARCYVVDIARVRHASHHIGASSSSSAYITPFFPDTLKVS